GVGEGQGGWQLRQLIFEPRLAGFFKSQQLGELCYLCVQAIECGILPGNFLLQIELHHHEYGKQENDTEYQRRQCVDEPRPVVHAAVAAASSCQRHGFQLNGQRARAPGPPVASWSRAAGWLVSPPSRGSSAVRCAYGAQGPGWPRRDWPLRRKRTCRPQPDRLRLASARSQNAPHR